jgi:hypothetical protein
MDLRTFQARWITGDLSPESTPLLAVDLLSEGIESPAIIELAGLNRPTLSEVAPLVERVLRENSLEPMERTAAYWRASYSVARDIVNGKLAPRDGAGRLWSIASALELPEGLRTFVYYAADYGEGPESPEAEAAWFDEQIRKDARALLDQAAPDGESPPTPAA